MSTYPQNTIFIAAQSKTSSQNPITYAHQFFIATFVLDCDTGKIVDVEINSICRITNDFIKQLLLGLSIATELDEIISRIERRYFGDSSRALIVLLKDTQRRFFNAKQELLKLPDSEEEIVCG